MLRMRLMSCPVLQCEPAETIRRDGVAGVVARGYDDEAACGPKRLERAGDVAPAVGVIEEVRLPEAKDVGLGRVDASYLNHEDALVANKRTVSVRRRDC